MQRFGNAGYEEALREGRAQYETRRGRVFEDENNWESFTQGFLEWFVLERDWGETCRAAVWTACEEEEDKDLREAMAALGSSQRCLAEVLRVDEDGLSIIDHIGGARFLIAEERKLRGIAEGDLVELRVVGFADRVLLGRGFLFHPPGTRSAILDLIETLRDRGESREVILDELALRKSRSRNYRHLSPLRAYQEKPA